MSSAITETDTYTATITAPDAGDAITAASVRTMGQGLANRSLHHENRIDDLETAMTAVETVADTAAADALAVYIGAFKPVAGTYASAAYLTFAIGESVTADTGFTLTSSDQWIQLPRAGVYEVQVDFHLSKTVSGSASAAVELEMLVATNATPTTSPYAFGVALGHRPEATDSFFSISGHSYISVSNLSLSRIALRVSSGLSAVLGSSQDNMRHMRFTIKWIGES